MKKVFVTRFGIDDENYAINVFALVMRSGEDDVIKGIEKVLSVSKKLSRLGLKKWSTIDIIRRSKNIGELELLLKDDDALRKLFLTEEVPDLGNALTDIYIQSVKESKVAFDNSVIVDANDYPVIKDFARKPENQLKNSAPDFLSVKKLASAIKVALEPEGYQKFIYRGERTEMSNLFDTFVKEKGIGQKASDFPDYGTYTAPLPIVSLSMSEYNGGLWVVKKDVILDITNVGNRLEIVFENRIPLDYVEYLITNAEQRGKILAKYGAENTAIFGRPLKDVVIAVEGNDATYRGAMLKKVVEINTGKKLAEANRNPK